MLNDHMRPELAAKITLFAETPNLLDANLFEWHHLGCLQLHLLKQVVNCLGAVDRHS
jgi:hypothetical protein